MFEKLVVSTSQRRRGRTSRFFLGTVLVYMSVVAAAFSLSVALSSPQLADSELHQPRSPDQLGLRLRSTESSESTALTTTEAPPLPTIGT